MKYRIYPDGTVIDENNFPELDGAFNYNGEGTDDYIAVEVPDVIVEYIEDSVLGK